MKDQIFDFIQANPAILILLPALMAWGIYRRYQRMKRRMGPQDERSQALVMVGLIGAAVVLAIWLTWF